MGTIYINSPGHMTKMFAMPIMVKSFKMFFLGTRSLMILKLGTTLNFYIMDVPGLALTHFMEGQIWSPMRLYWENC